MFKINSDLSIYATRGDVLAFDVSAKQDDETYIFSADDIVRIKVFEKKDCGRVLLQKDFPATAGLDYVEVSLESADTKIGEHISKPMDYWYEVELNPETKPETIIGYDTKGAKVFRLFPEGADL
jgi:hypothetical protein